MAPVHPDPYGWGTHGSHMAGVIAPRVLGPDVHKFFTTQTDGHPDPLFEWADHGMDTPMGWFELCAFTGYGKVLFIVRTRYLCSGDEVEQPLGDTMAGPVYWHPSLEYVQEIARQMLDGSRACLVWNMNSWDPSIAHAIEIRERVPGGFRIVAQLPTEEERKRYREETTA